MTFRLRNHSVLTSSENGSPHHPGQPLSPIASGEPAIERENALYDTSGALNPITDMYTMMELIAQRTKELLHVEGVSVIFCDQQEGQLYFPIVAGEEKEIADRLKRFRLPVDSGVAGWVFCEGKPALVPDVNVDKRFCREADENTGFMTRSILCAPLWGKGGPLGVLEAVNRRDGESTQEDQYLLEAMANDIAISIDLGQEVAQRKQTEAALRAAKEELAKAYRLRDEFLANMSHELRTPLNAILCMSEILRKDIYGSPLDERQFGCLQRIEESGHQLLHLINGILDVAKINAGKLGLEIRPVLVQLVCKASLRSISKEARDKKLQVCSNFDTTVTTLRADERRLKQILVNLLDNAVKFTPEGGAIGLDVVGDAERRMVHFTVWDTGIGISQDDMDLLSQPFVQLDGGLSRQHSGAGLGLTLAHKMTELHGGSISVDSEVGHGSLFTVSLPWQEQVNN